MLRFQEAIDQIIACAKVLKTETIDLDEALFKVLAEDVSYDIHMPPFNKSAMDGYACLRADLEKELTVIDTVYAGKSGVSKIDRGQCVKIMTGAPIPVGADMVFMQEDAESIFANRVKCLIPDSKDNICYLGEDIKRGDVVVSKHTYLQAKHMPLLAGAGYDQVQVYQQPIVHVLTTGTELVEPRNIPEPYQIRNSNASQIIAQLNTLNIPQVYHGIMEDDEIQLKSEIEKILEEADVLIMSGGVSVGEFDLIPSIILDLGLKIEIDKTAIQPGKPMVFAHGGGKYIFGLSGNPVASFIQFELYVKPFLYTVQGTQFKPLRFQLPLASKYNRKKSGRHAFGPAKITGNNQIEPLKFNGSANISALCHADCLMEVPIGVEAIKENTMVFIRPL